MLQDLIRAFSALSADLVVAVRNGDESRVEIFDAEIEMLLSRIHRAHADTIEDINCQIDFFAQLAVKNSEDDESVRRFTQMMLDLTNRYLGAEKPKPSASIDVKPLSLSEGYDASIQEMLLDSFPERVALIGLDYRYVYVNKRNARFHDMSPSAFIGKHLSDIIGIERFLSRAQPRLDQCFGGASVSYEYEIADSAGRLFDVDCRMSPFIGPDTAIAGAIIVLSMQPLFARLGISAV